MESCGICVKWHWTALLCSEFVFQTSIWRVELLEDHGLHRGKLQYQQHDVIFKEMATFKEFLAESSCGCSGFDAHIFVLVFL